MSSVSPKSDTLINPSPSILCFVISYVPSSLIIKHCQIRCLHAVSGGQVAMNKLKLKTFPLISGNTSPDMSS